MLLLSMLSLVAATAAAGAAMVWCQSHDGHVPEWWL